MSISFQSEYPTGKIGYDAIKSTLDLNVQNSNIQWNENIPTFQKYAKYDSVSKMLTFFEDEEGKYENNQVIGNETFWTGIERSMSRIQVPWNSLRNDIITITFNTSIKPAYQCNYFTNMHNLAHVLNMFNLDTSEIHRMDNMFNNCDDIESLDLSSFDTSHVETMAYMFRDCSSLRLLDLSSFDTLHVTDMNNMFSGCINLAALDVSNFNTSNVTNISTMFSLCSELSVLDVSSFDTSNVTLMTGVFQHCSNITSLDLSTFNTSKVTDMGEMFKCCYKLSDLDISSFDTSSVTIMSSMFEDCYTALESLDLVNFDTSSVTTMENMFYGCEQLANIYVSNSWNTANVTVSTKMFLGCICLPNYGINVVDKTNAHYNEGGYLELGKEAYIRVDTINSVITIFKDDIGKYSDREQVPSTSHPSTNDVIYTGIETRAWSSKYNFDPKWIGNGHLWDYVIQDKIKPISTYSWFGNARTITGLENLNTSKVTNMSSMFICDEERNNTISSLDLSSFDTSKVTNMNSMFSGCTNLTSLNVSSFDTSNVINMYNMFRKCTSIQNIDLSSFDTSNVTDMGSMFSGCENVNNIYVSEKWNVSKIIVDSARDSSYDMFYGCTNLPNFDPTVINKLKAHYNEGGYLTYKSNN